MGDTAVIPLTLLPGRTDTTRIGRDRLELLTALIEAPAFDPLFRDTLIFIPPQHPLYAWQCAVDGCKRIRRISHNLCNTHNLEWEQAERTGQTKRAFMDAATALSAARGVDYGRCLICPDRPAISPTTRLCQQHQTRWQYGEAADTDRSRFEYWARTQHPLPGYGLCQARCPFRPVPSLCLQHLNRYNIDNRPGAARSHNSRGPLKDGRPLPVTYGDEKAFRASCATAEPVTQPGLDNLHALPPAAAGRDPVGPARPCPVRAALRVDHQRHQQPRHSSTRPSSRSPAPSSRGCRRTPTPRRNGRPSARGANCR